jgi:hypothetical protein
VEIQVTAVTHTPADGLLIFALARDLNSAMEAGTPVRFEISKPDAARNIETGKSYVLTLEPGT